ncbi:MAG: hypothetical protein LBU16_08510 [Treponema sp.]|nr:hypothetical protein [Treponema sp.]
MNKRGVRQSVFCAALGLACAGGFAGFAEDWYVSNPGGMALEPAFSRFAIRGKYALSVGAAEEADIPDRLRKYYDPSFRIELRCLYEDGLLTRRQWTFRDDRETARVAAAFEDDNSGFIELYNADKLIVESHQLAADGSAYITYYYYNRSFLIRAETRRFTPLPKEEAPVSAEDEASATPAVEAPPQAVEGIDAVPVPRALNIPVTEPIVTEEGTEETVWTDFYRYTRANALRSVERRYISVPTEGQETELLRFPQLILAVAAEDEFMQPASVVSSGFFEDVIINSGDRILYTTDSRGRVLSEVRRDENDKVVGEVVNTWSGERLVSVAWKSEEEERLIEYEYDAAGDRVLERNFRDGELERTVRREGEQEIEELYLNGEVALRAVWVEGRKVSEEPVHPVRSRRSSE